MKKTTFLAWYRNPSRASEDALAIAYRDGQDNWRRMCPDFVFLHGPDDEVKVSIIDPHGHHLADALPKLRGLSEFVSALPSRILCFTLNLCEVGVDLASVGPALARLAHGALCGG